jgi:transketolase
MRGSAKLIDDIRNPEEVALRNGYGDGMVLVGEKHPNAVVLCADLSESTRSYKFKEKFPDRYVQVGVQEQLLAACAAGMALGGKMPFITSYAMFCPGRAWEQVRTNICLNDVNVKVIGSHAGVSVGPDGATHQAIEDMAIMRCIPNMTVVAPCDAIEARKATLAIADREGPCYMRLARANTPVFTTEETPFELGKAGIFRDGKDVALIACGSLVHNAVIAALDLAEEGLDCMVVNMHTVKPLDEKAVLHAAEECGAVVTIEEHQIAGGLGGAVAEYLAKARPTPMEFIGVPNKFGESGDPKELVEHFGMGVKDIKAAAKKAVKRKR